MAKKKKVKVEDVSSSKSETKKKPQLRHVVISNSNVNAAIEFWMRSMSLMDAKEHIIAIRKAQSDGLDTFTELEMIIEKEVSK